MIAPVGLIVVGMVLCVVSLVAGRRSPIAADLIAIVAAALVLSGILWGLA